MRKVRPDPGAVMVGAMSVGGREVRFVDATAANDPESLTLLLACASGGRRGAKDAPVVGADIPDWIAVYNHRDDRPVRLRVFIDASPLLRRSAHLVLTGDRPSFTLLKRVRGARCHRPATFVNRMRLAGALTEIVRSRPEATGIAFCGNTKGLDVRSLIGGPNRSVTNG
jgi:hypothetical protein